MCDCCFYITQSDQAVRAEGHNALSFIGNMIHLGIEGIFRVISVDLNTLRGFQNRVEEEVVAPTIDQPQ